MGGITTNLKIPYPVGTDRVADGDNAMQALAERVDARLPWGRLGHASLTVATGAITGEYVIPQLSVTVTVPANRVIRPWVFMPNVNASVVGTMGVAYLKQDGANICVDCKYYSNASFGLAYFLQTILTPSAGSHTYTVSLQAALQGPVTNNAGSPHLYSYLVVEDIGPTSLA
jgi:hypothetical protein